jgi:hypothetical protein
MTFFIAHTRSSIKKKFHRRSISSFHSTVYRLCRCHSDVPKVSKMFTITRNINLKWWQWSNQRPKGNWFMKETFFRKLCDTVAFIIPSHTGGLFPASVIEKLSFTSASDPTDLLTYGSNFSFEMSFVKLTIMSRRVFFRNTNYIPNSHLTYPNVL